MVHATLIGDYPQERLIKDMLPGEEGYTVPWAYNLDTEDLKEWFGVSEEKLGTAHMRVCCTALGEYTVQVEEAEYSNVGDCLRLAFDRN